MLLLMLLCLGSAALFSFLLILLLRPLLVRYAMARPNARSSHTSPTPQGAGIAVILSVFLVYGGIYGVLLNHAPPAAFYGLFLAVLILALVSGMDDVRPISAKIRILVHFFCVALAVWSMHALSDLETLLIWASTTPKTVQFLPFLPFSIELLLWIIAGVWFVNLTNFLDGLDWMMVVILCPLFLGCALLLFFRHEWDWVLLACCLLGAMLGFAIFNKPVAKVFLGDVGAVPLGLCAAMLLYKLALSGAWVSSLILPLYAVLDASITLMRRLWLRQPFWQAHRTHFYQKATDNGFSVMQVVMHILALNLFLVMLAVFAAVNRFAAYQGLVFVSSLCATLGVLWHFSRSRKV
jgi:UDP-N-acetylmuramyl pentapeptide phosphotransferase/UDP-N-acetylglucosamine-1-phosphate transferase